MRAHHVTGTILLAAALTGCGTAPAPLTQNAAFLTRSTEPRYQWRGDGRIGSTACRSGYEAGHGPAPSGCVLDNVFAAQVASPTHMVAPPTPGPAYAAPTAAAAHAYIYGKDGGTAGAPDARVARPGQQVAVPTEDAYRPPATSTEDAPEG